MSESYFSYLIFHITKSLEREPQQRCHEWIELPLSGRCHAGISS